MRTPQKRAFLPALFFALILSLCVCHPGYGQLFHPASGVATANYPTVTAAGDLNGDTIPDLVVGTSLDPSPLEGQIQVLLGTGSGSFGAPTTVVTEMYTTFNDIKVVDVDADGNVDILAAISVTAGKAFLGSGAMLYRGVGDGTFAPGEELVGEQYTWYPSVTAGDLNHDGNTDICVGLYWVDSPSLIHVFLNDGVGGFVEQPAHPVTGVVSSVLLEDLDGDGSLDLALTEITTESVVVLEGQGDGTFLEIGTYGVDDEPVQIATADLNGNTFPDLVTVNATAETVSVLFGQGDGTFLGGTSFGVGGASPRALDLGDLDGDGVTDLVTANSGSDTVSALLGLGGGSFDAPETFPVGTAPLDVTLADLNGDTHLDCIAANSTGTEVSVLLNGQGDPPPWGPASVMGTASGDVSTAANLGFLLLLPLLILRWMKCRKQ